MEKLLKFNYEPECNVEINDIFKNVEFIEKEENTIEELYKNIEIKKDKYIFIDDWIITSILFK